jgi:hypothetical protein
LNERERKARRETGEKRLGRETGEKRLRCLRPEGSDLGKREEKYGLIKEARTGTRDTHRHNRWRVYRHRYATIYVDDLRCK